LAERIDWSYHLEEYAKSLDIDPVSVQVYCEANGLPFGSAKRHISTKKARLHLGKDKKKTKTRPTVKSKAQESGSLTINKKPAKKTGAKAGHKNSRTTGAAVPLERIPAAIVKKAVINMAENDTNHTRPLERVLTVLHAQFEYAVQNQINMHAVISHLYDADEMPDKEQWNEGEAYVLKRYRCDAASGSSLAGLADTISQVQKRQAEILIKRRELSSYTRIEELEIIQNAYERRITEGLTATDTIRLIEAYGIAPPISLAKEMEKEITFIEPPEEVDPDEISEAQLIAEQVAFKDSLGAQMDKFIGGRRELVETMVADADALNSGESLSEEDFQG
jgi:hypothetical protein